jgi:hypothetical protein
MDPSRYFAAQTDLLKAISSNSPKESHFSPLDELDQVKYNLFVQQLKQEADKIMTQSIPTQLKQEKQTLEKVTFF